MSQMARSGMTLDEYRHRLDEIHTAIGADSTLSAGESSRRRRVLEFQLSVDFRLGADFPKERRRALARIHAEMCRQCDAARRQLEAGAISQREFLTIQERERIRMMEGFASELDATDFLAFTDSPRTNYVD